MTSGTDRPRRKIPPPIREAAATGSGVPLARSIGDLAERRHAALRKHFGKAQTQPKGLRAQTALCVDQRVRLDRFMARRHYSESEALRRVVEAGLAKLEPLDPDNPITDRERAAVCAKQGKRARIAKGTRALAERGEAEGVQPAPSQRVVGRPPPGGKPLGNPDPFTDE